MRLPFRSILSALFSVGALLVMAGNARAQKPPVINRNPSPTITRSYSVTGRVSDGSDHTMLNSVRVELRSFGGAMVASAFTSGDGNFDIENVARGSYMLVVEEMGYQSSSQRIDVDGSVVGVSVDLRKLTGPAGTSAKGSATISARELSIPHKAHDAMEKGLSLLYAKADYPGSLKQFQQAIEKYPDYYEAYTQEGVAHLKMGDAAGSEQAFRKSIEVSKDKYADAFFWLATLLSDNERFADAETAARKAVELNSSSWQANSELSRALLGLNRAAEAETSARAAVDLQPGNANLHLLLANIHMQQKNDVALLDDLNSYLKLAPTGSFASQVRQQRDEVEHNLADTKAAPAASGAVNP